MMQRTARLVLWALMATPVAAPLAAQAEVFTVAPVEVPDLKALYGRIESRFVVPARGRTGGTITALDVTEGSLVTAGQVIGRILDSKLESQLAATEARINAAQSQLRNAEAELARSEALLARGTTTVQRVDLVRTTVEVARTGVAEAEAARDVARQQIAEGEVLAPAAGRVLSVPVRLGEVVTPGEAIATIAGGGVFLRLAIPERHATDLKMGGDVAIEGGAGRIEKIYPQIDNGRVIVDVAVEGLSDAFIGQRILVQVPVATRSVLAVPQAAIVVQGGLDLLRIESPGGEVSLTVVPGRTVQTGAGPMVEILTGLRAGDHVILP